MKDSIEGHLKEAFAVLRKEEKPTAPKFDTLAPAVVEHRPAESLHARRTSTFRLHRRQLVTGLSAAAVVALVMVLQGPGERDAFETFLAQASAETSLGFWRAPSDFLLTFEGREFYYDVPRVTDSEAMIALMPTDGLPQKQMEQ